MYKLDHSDGKVKSAQYIRDSLKMPQLRRHDQEWAIDRSPERGAEESVEIPGAASTAHCATSG